MSKNNALPVNTTNLVKYLEHSFSSSLTFLGEMMQNSRRAKASYVGFTVTENGDDTCNLTVTDDGVGVTKDSLLFTVAESGWGNCEETKDVVESEDPFGMGFLSVLFACKHVSICSKGFFIRGSTADILYKNTFEHGDASSVEAGTEIRMLVVKATHKQIAGRIQYLAKGFPIEVKLNGSDVPRPYADLSYAFDEPFGQMIVVDKRYPNSASISLFLQGLPVKASTHLSGVYSSPDVVVHLNSKLFKARVPDREQLYDGEACINLVKAAYEERHFAYYQDFAKSSPYEFASYFKSLRYQGSRYIQLFNNINYLPKHVLVAPNRDLPCISLGDFDGDPWVDEANYPVAREDIMNGNYLLFDLQDDSDMEHNGAVLETWIHLTQDEGAHDCLIYRGGLASGHWINDLPINRRIAYNDLSTGVSAGEFKEASFSSKWVDFTVRFCKFYEISVTYAGDVPEGQEAPKFEPIIVEDTPLWDGSYVYVPSGCTAYEATNVLRQLSNFYDSDMGDSDYDALEDVSSAFVSFVNNNRSDNAVDVLNSLTSDVDFSSVPLLKGKKFVLNIDERGNRSFSLFGEG